MRQYSSDSLYNHVMRSWLFGALIVNHNETLSQTVDLEAHAVAALMHDLGVTEGSPFISTDRRFEVDGAFAATEFLSGDDSGKDWDGRRVQLVWDAIALHAENAISKFKEPSVAVTSDGVRVDFLGPSYGVTSDEYAAVVNEFPTDGFIAGFNSSLLWIAETKPNSTYGKSFLAGFRLDTVRVLIPRQIRGNSHGVTTSLPIILRLDRGSLTLSPVFITSW